MTDQMRIAEVVDRTGVSRELIHHYLRQGLLPRSETRAAYSESQVRLLHQIKVLRDEHHLPLEIIRAVFAFFGFEPDRLEALTLADSFANRMARLAEGGGALSTRTLDPDALAREAELPPGRLSVYVEAGLVRPLEAGTDARFSTYDARVLAVCERAIAQGIPFEALRTIAAFVRTAFELEHPLLFPTLRGGAEGGASLLGEVVLRLELVTSLIQSLLQGLVAHRLRDLATLPVSEAGALDHLIYRPSDAFVRRHGLEAELSHAQQRLGRYPDDPAEWRRAVELLLHAGRYPEAVFFAEQGLARLPGDPTLEAALGRALLAVGQRARGLTHLARVEGPNARLLEALTTLTPSSPGAAVDQSTLVDLPARLQQALAEAAADPPARRLEAELLTGWALTALPSALRDAPRGLALLAQVLAELEATPAAAFPLPGLRERLLINAAWLRYRALGAPEGEATIPPGEREALRTLICRLDPGSHFADQVFQDPPEPGPANASSRGAEAPTPRDHPEE